MKICSYCNTENEDSAKVCTACGANEFRYRCENCGTVYDSGTYCPKCGVKAGQQAKQCPRCGTRYYSAACPQCGWVPGNDSREERRAERREERAEQRAASAAEQPAKKRNTLLWVLGWILLFPLPLTILMLKNRKLPLIVRLAIIAAGWLVYIGIGNSGTKKDAAVPADVPAVTATAEPETVPAGT